MVQRYIPRWLIEVGLVVAAVMVYRKSASVRDKALAHPLVAAVVRAAPATPAAKRAAYYAISLGVFVAATYRWWVLRRRLLRHDGPIDAARAAAGSAAAAVELASQQLAEVLGHASATERELAACRLAIADMQQAVRRVEQQERKKQGVQQQLPLVEAAEQVDVLVPAGVENVNKGSAFSQAEHVICADDPQPTP
eukprot:COSAG01_NODE_10313_length_2194_cov_42.537947_1_plen_195_part_00